MTRLCLPELLSFAQLILAAEAGVIKEADALVPETEVGVEGAARVPVRLGVPGEGSRVLVDNK